MPDNCYALLWAAFYQLLSRGSNGLPFYWSDKFVVVVVVIIVLLLSFVSDKQYKQNKTKKTNIPLSLGFVIIWWFCDVFERQEINYGGYKMAAVYTNDLIKCGMTWLSCCTLQKIHFWSTLEPLIFIIIADIGSCFGPKHLTKSSAASITTVVLRICLGQGLVFKRKF